QDCVAASNLAKQLGVPFASEAIDVTAYKRRTHTSTQEAARAVRRRFLRDAASAAGCSRIALGHTASDRLETCLLNLLRGTGPEGLSGFPPIELPLVRPLYHVTRASVERFCQARGLQVRSDSSNQDLSYSRNRVRLELLPYLQDHFNRSVPEAILRLADLCRDESSYLNYVAQDALHTLCIRQCGEELVLDGARLTELPPAVARRALRLGILRVRGALEGVTHEQIDSLLRGAAGTQETARDLPLFQGRTVSLQAGGGAVRIAQRPAPASPLPWEAMLQTPGCTEVRQAGLLVVCRNVSKDDTNWDETDRRDGLRLLDRIALPREAASEPLVMRSRRPGDRIRLRGTGTRKLQDLFVDIKAPLALRDRIGVLCAADGTILAVPGVASSEIALATDVPGDGKGECLLVLCYALIQDVFARRNTTAYRIRPE
ncbi:MAG TPA: tRNA lysidine(34) synthetase TilS, partial [Chthonomonadales bacterium]|nr:tRNA lysidine(34) synthetase TilS [Chthonomonadales bacterium]